MQQTCIAHDRDDDREDRSMLFNDAVNYKDCVASVACEWSIGGMLLTGEEGRRTFGSASEHTPTRVVRVCLVTRHLVLVCV